jgi:hypothetical protein
MIRDINDEKRCSVLKACEKLNLKLKSISEKQNGKQKLWYFSIYGDTNDFNVMKALINNIVVETHFAELGNLYDCDNETLNLFSQIVNDTINIKHQEDILNKKFLDFIFGIKDLSVLEKIKKDYYLNDNCKLLLDDRIKILKGEKTSFEVWLERKVEKDD